MNKTRLDEAVSVAQQAWREVIVKDDARSEEAMRAALIAGVKVLMGEVVAEWRESSDKHYASYERTATRFNCDWESKARSETLSDCADEVERLYAPDLGGGK